MALFGLPRPTFFYPTIVGNSITIDFDDPVQIVIPSVLAVGTENIAADGTRERLHQRLERRVTLRASLLLGSVSGILQTIEFWWESHAALGKQSTLVLDRWTPPACAFASESAGNVPVGAHLWYVAFVASGVIHRLGPAFAYTVTSSAKAVVLASVSVGPSGTTARNIYRFGPSGIQLVGTINDNSTTGFTDNLADGSLGAVAPHYGTIETDYWNRTFTKAELLTPAFQAPRSLPSLSRDLFALELTFRQGT